MPHKRLELVRRWYDAERTIGELYFGGEPLCFTMEPGSEDVHAPRVQHGFYYLERHGWEEDSRARFRRTWALVGKDVSHYAEAGVSRSAILFHSGNDDDETRGCILLGLTLGHHGREPWVLASQDAMERLRQVISDQDAFLVVRGG